jgi:hypothetical protein
MAFRVGFVSCGPKPEPASLFQADTMKKTLLLGLLAAASLTLTVSSCSNPDFQKNDEVVDTPLPPVPAAAEGQDSAATAEAAAKEEINAVNATNAIKKMQPQM